MSSRAALRAVPVEDRAWLLAALGDALNESRADTATVFPVAPGTEHATVEHLRSQTLPASTAVVIRTSGSSGIPKSVALSAQALRASATATHEALLRDEDPDSPPQWLVALPGHLISGLQMLVRSVVAGTDPVFVDGPFDPAALLAAAERMQQERRYVSLVPTQLARLLDLAEHDDDAADMLRSFAAVLVGGQSVSVTVRQRAHDAGVALRRSYGMTETSGGCVYDGVAIGDTQVRIREGEVQLAGSSLALGYVGDPQLTAERFLTDDSFDGRPTRWYRTGDAGEMLGGTLQVTGRLDRVIISGGVNVSLDEIERVAAEFAGWEGTVALGITDPEWGERPLLAVPGKVESIAPESFAEVRTAIRSELGPAAAPERMVTVDDFPYLPGGKPDRVGLAALIQQRIEE